MINSTKRLLAKLVNLNFNKYKQSYSQCGEDMIVEYVFRLMGIQHPTYIDIGANHPFILSNTAYFYLNGSNGINIEANPELSKKFILYRPKDINLNVGIGNVEGSLPFYIMSDNKLSTFSKSEYEKYLKTENLKLKKMEFIEVKTLTSVLDFYNKGVFPDYLSLDVEGLDYDIIQCITPQKSSPKVICVESHEYSSVGYGNKRVEIIDYLSSNNYVEYANTGLNSIFVRIDCLNFK